VFKVLEARLQGGFRQKLWNSWPQSQD